MCYDLKSKMNADFLKETMKRKLEKLENSDANVKKDVKTKDVKMYALNKIASPS